MGNYNKGWGVPTAIVVMLVGFAVLTFGVFYYFVPKSECVECDLGSVSQGNEYNFTQLTGPIATTTLIKYKPGLVLGSVIVTEDQAGAVVLYDATSTTAYSKTNGTRIADFTTATPEATYTFDVTLTKGLVVESADGFLFAGDWTITYR